LKRLKDLVKWLTDLWFFDMIGKGKSAFSLIMDEYPYSINEFTIKLDEITGLIDVTKSPVNMPEKTNANGFWKYNEDKILKQLEQYIAGTYSQHYVDRTGGGTEQTLDKIKHNRREGFCAGNITKYTDRYDTKGTPRADLFKVLHYTILLINHLNLVENK